VVIAVAIAVAAIYVNKAVVCQDAVAGTKTVRLCAPPSAVQLAFLFIPALVLLLPDLSEVTFLGIGIKRDLDQTKEKVDESQGTSTEQVEDLVRASALLTDRLDELSSGVHDLELMSVRDTDVLRKTLETLATVEQRVSQIEDVTDDHPSA
jgi:hypothetical protein